MGGRSMHYRNDLTADGYFPAVSMDQPEVMRDVQQPPPVALRLARRDWCKALSW